MRGKWISGGADNPYWSGIKEFVVCLERRIHIKYSVRKTELLLSKAGVSSSPNNMNIEAVNPCDGSCDNQELPKEFQERLESFLASGRPYTADDEDITALLAAYPRKNGMKF